MIYSALFLATVVLTGGYGIRLIWLGVRRGPEVES